MSSPLFCRRRCSRPAVVVYAGQVMWQAYQQQKHRPLRSIRLLCSEVSYISGDHFIAVAGVLF